MIANLKMVRTAAHDKLPVGGLWKDEPDLVTFDLPQAGLKCQLVRNEEVGTWCGYVGVPQGHAWHGKSYHELDTVFVHGKLTYAGESNPNDPPGYWWLGFDCAHFDDQIPNFGRTFPGSDYKTWSYVVLEVLKLANQATGGEYKLILEEWTIRVARRWTWEATWEAQQTGECVRGQAN